MTITIRPAAPADVEAIADFNVRLALETEYLKLDPEVVQRGVSRLIDSPGRGYYRVAELDGITAGSLMVTYEWSDWRDGDIWWIQSVYVAENARRQGVFRALYDHIVDSASAHEGVRCVRLYVERNNRTAQATYTGLGMHETAYRLYEVGV